MSHNNIDRPVLGRAEKEDSRAAEGCVYAGSTSRSGSVTQAAITKLQNGDPIGKNLSSQGRER